MIIFINGNMNSGKSTVARLLKEKIEKPAVIEIDELRNFIDWMPIGEAVPINWENALAVIKNFVKNGLNVIIPYPLSKVNFDMVSKELENVGTKVYFVTLNPQIEALLANRGTRELPEEDIVRIKQLHEKKIAEQEYGITIDNSNQSPNETVEEILSYIKNRT